MHYVYVIQSNKTKELYIGFTQDCQARLEVHNKGGNVSTKSARPWKLIYLEGYCHKDDALSRELFLKGGSGRIYINKQLSNYFKS